MMRLSTSSTSPRKYPVMSPRVVPSTVARIVAAGATMRMSRAPSMIRESTSRPTRSVPSRCSELGGARSFSGSVANGSSGVIASPRIAHTTQIPMIAMPTMKTFERRSSASCSRRALLSASEGGAVAAGASAPIEVPAAVIPGPPVGRAG